MFFKCLLMVRFYNYFMTGGTRQWGGSNCWNYDRLGHFRFAVDAIGMFKKSILKSFMARE